MAKKTTKRAKKAPRPAANVSFITTLDRSKNRFLSRIAPEHQKVAWFGQELVQDVWKDKYSWNDEKLPTDTFARVAYAVYATDGDHAQEAFEAMDAGLWMPGGRIIAGAGTSKRVTLMNCYVNKRLEDSLDDIMEGVRVAALTQQQGGGIGTDFSTLRPTGAVLHRTGAAASGPLPFMDMWHSMCATIMSAGDRRGAMMGTLSDTHPDLPKFIVAKQQKGKLTNFNVSVLVSDAFVEAVRENEEWLLHFPTAPKQREPFLEEYDFFDDEGTPQFVYSVWQARDLWELILRNTYDWSEPGIIFIDRVNSCNNLQYCEEIHCTNPCGEQPLPPNGTCNLGAINLARLVLNPFTDRAEINWDLLSQIAKIGMRFLDNVIEITNYPLLEQQEEEFAKRRTGLGVSGLANALAQLKLRYGSAAAVTITERIFQHICLASYEESMELAIERGPFPKFDKRGYLDKTFAGLNLSAEYQDRICRTGIRNGVLLTVAPTGTTSILYGNISSGIEPVFLHRIERSVRQADDTFRKYEAWDYNALLYRAMFGSQELPNYFVTSEDLTIEDHVATQAAVQRWVDASVSKTINVPERTTYEEFKKVYDLAYTLGCKGCTTYRPSDVRGSILAKPAQSGTLEGSGTTLARRETVLQGITRKIKWPSMASALYITINHTAEGLPFEVFFNSKDAKSQEWMTGLSLMISAILRKGGDVSFISEELGAVQSVHDTAWMRAEGEEKSKFFGSLIAYIGFILGKDLNSTAWKDSRALQLTVEPTRERCPQCHAPALTRKEGCKVCDNCSYSDCS